MERNEKELVKTYVPHLRYDRAEPFALQGIGYTLYGEKMNKELLDSGMKIWQNGERGISAKSPSCRRIIQAPPEGMAIEYAFYYDFDIQHLYDLEHAFVYLDREGQIVGVESSFHGKVLNSRIEGITQYEGTHPVLYVQPGKHALLPAPAYFQLVIDRDTACHRDAGEAGFLIGPMFEGRLFPDRGRARKVETYIRRNYAFRPTWDFTEKSPDGRSTEELLMPWEELDGLMLRRLGEWSRRIEEDTPA